MKFRMPRAVRGQVFMFTLLLVTIVGLTMFVYGASNEVARVVQADMRTRGALEQAREALIARAVADVNRPGSLPCPDTDDDGSAELLAGVDCPSYIGRLPWRTLGVGDLRDENGERLWYALSPSFRDHTTVQINSDSKGNRTVYGGSVSSTLTTQAAAVIFAPGTALPGQARDAVMATCNMSGAPVSMRRDRCAVNYLETDGAATPAWNNASSTGPYMSDRLTLVFNDKLLVMSTTDFMPLVERRVARELREALRAYRENSKTAAIVAGGCDCFPWPDGNNDGGSDTNTNRGRVPVNALPHPWGWSWINGATGKPFINPLTGLVFPPIPSLPPYFAANNWPSMIYYAVAKTSLQGGGATCMTCSANATLLVDGSGGYGMVLLTPGIIAPAQTRSAWAHYIDDAQNRDANPQPAGGGAAADPASNDEYVTPPKACSPGQCPTAVAGVQRCVASTAQCPPNVTAPIRDRLYSITSPPPNAQCGPNASSLLKNAPCHTKGNNVKAVCQDAADNLAACSCATSGNTMITPPCRNTLNPPACQTAVQTLQSCNS